MHTAVYARTIGTEPELLPGLCRSVEARGDLVIATFTDDARIEGEGKNSGWRRLLADLGQIDQIVLNDPGDLPGRSVNDLLATLMILVSHEVSVVVPSQGIDTSTGSAGVLELIGAYRRAKLSQAIRQGQAKSSKRNGRPPIPAGVRRRILADLAAGAGIRPTAKKHCVSAGYVAAAKKAMMAVNTDRLAA